MNFAFVACMVALCGLEYLLGLEDILQRGQWAATRAGWGTGEGEGCGHPLTPADQATSNYSNRLFSVYFGGKRSGNPLARWAKANP